MKKKFIGIVVLFAGISVFALDISTYVPMNRSVKSYTITDYAISSKFGEYYRTPEIKEKRVFQDGVETESYEFTPHDVITNKIVNKYDEEGNLISQVASNANGEIIWRNKITYNEKGLQADSSEESASGILKSRTIYTYNSSNKLVDETTYDGNGALVWKIIYAYDTEKLVRESHYYADGLLYEAKEYKYNDNGSLDSISTLGPIGANAVYRELFRYTNGILTEVTTVDRENRTTARKILRYDDEGNLQRVSDYTVAKKFGTTVNELSDMQEYTYQY